jgi:hypothetical protein
MASNQQSLKEIFALYCKEWENGKDPKVNDFVNRYPAELRSKIKEILTTQAFIDEIAELDPLTMEQKKSEFAMLMKKITANQNLTDDSLSNKGHAKNDPDSKYYCLMPNAWNILFSAKPDTDLVCNDKTYEINNDLRTTCPHLYPGEISCNIQEDVSLSDTINKEIRKFQFKVVNTVKWGENHNVRLDETFFKCKKLNAHSMNENRNLLFLTGLSYPSQLNRSIFQPSNTPSPDDYKFETFLGTNEVICHDIIENTKDNADFFVKDMSTVINKRWLNALWKTKQRNEGLKIRVLCEKGSLWWIWGKPKKNVSYMSYFQKRTRSVARVTKKNDKTSVNGFREWLKNIDIKIRMIKEKSDSQIAKKEYPFLLRFDNNFVIPSYKITNDRTQRRTEEKIKFASISSEDTEFAKVIESEFEKTWKMAERVV